ncbi:mucin-2-like isoform X3 [Cydia strobilella]|uniref:mucin-2-like isoform X3 n=1 Tax=Cydia strobilella TaxID=1100964 RepID=UPI003003B46E
MRAGVWCVALALLAVGGALRPTQAEGTTRVGRRLSIHTSTESSALGQEHASTPRRGSRRREETSPRQAVRRTRTRAPQIEEVTEPETKRNTTDESFDSRKAYSRTRNRPEPEEDTPKANVIRSRTRFNRPAPTQPTPTTKAPEVTSPIIDESKIEVINSTLEEITKMVFKEYEPVTQSNRRSSTRTIANVTQRRRSRVNVRTNEQSDLTSSGTTNSISISEKGPTTDKMIDLRGSRKLRYKQRQSDTDTNLTGLGITASNEVQQSSQKEIPSQETKLSAPVENVQQSTETNPLKTTTLKVMRIVRRPVQRGKGSFKPNASLSLAKKRSDEVSEDDNYPEPFKALLQAKNASLRPKPNVEKELKNAIKPDDKPTESTVAPNTLTTKAPSYKFRSQQTTRSRKFSHLTSSTVSNTEQSSDKPPYKYNRKFKMSTTEAPKTELKINSKRVETNNLLKKTSHRPTFYSRRNSSKSDASTTTPSNDESLNIGSALESIAKHKATLSRTSYYSRQRNSKKVLTTSIPSTEEPFKDSNSVIETADRKNADNVDIPLIYTLLKPTDVSQNENNLDISQNENNSEKPHKMFVIAVTSNESPESSTENEMTSNTVEETEVRSVVGSSTSKYHATYTVPQTTSKVEERDVLSAVPPIRNIPTRKFGRGRVSSRSQNDGVSEEPVTRDRGAGKYTDSYTKTTEASTNGINPDTEKSRHRFSSKFRASHDKPIYRATVPTVTPSTIEGDEYQLGPDMNAITFTQTRSPAELLKLSESLVKPHVMNVETSQHSQSVTVSIFDALADILTSTPRNRLSSTTEVQKQNIKTDSIQSLNVVSSNINVNSGVLPNQDTLNVIVNTNVQNTDKTLNVNNPSVAASAASTSTPQSLPTPIPTTPVSARKPFAFKVLYSEPTDKLTTALEPTSNQPSTDNPSMVYNTVSDLLLSNNNVVSSELTSMLSSNINNILRNMDDRTKSRVSADMNRILKNLIPRAIGGLDNDVDSTPNTTPYSLEEIKDTENVNFDVNLNMNGNPATFDLLQNVGNTSNVNITTGVANTVNGVEQPDFTQDGNDQGFSQLASILPESNDGRTTTANFNRLITAPTTTVTVTPSDAASPNLASSFVPKNSDSIVIESGVNNNAAPNNPNVSFPFLSNFQIDDFTTQNSGNFNNTSVLQSVPIPFSAVPATPFQNDDDSNIQDINDVTPLQLWILSKKARVLKLIEDLIRDHNNELANATALTDMFRQSDNSPISERLTKIMSTMNTTTKSTDSDDSSLSPTPSLPSPLSTLPSNESFEANLTTSTTSSEVAISNESFTTVSASLSDISTSTSSTSSNAETATAMSTTEAIELSNRSLNESTMATTIQEITTQSIETVTPTDVATTTQANQETTTQNDIETTTEISTSALNLKDSSRGVTTVASKPAEQSTASHVLSLRTTTMLPSVDEILLNSISSAAKEEMVISSMTSSTRQPTILTLDIDPETKQIRTEKPGEIKFISIDEVTTTTSPNTNVLKLASSKSPATTITSQMETSTESSTQTPQIPTQVQNDDRTTTGQVAAGTITDAVSESTTVQSVLTTSTTEASTTPIASTEPVTTTTMAPVTTTTETTTTTAKAIETTTEVRTTLRTTLRTTTVPPTTSAPTTAAETILPSTATSAPTEGVTKDDLKRYQEDAALLEAILSGAERLPKKLNFNTLDQNTGTSSFNTQTKLASATKQSDDDKFLQQLLSVAGKNPHTLTVPNIGGNIKVNGVQTTTARSIEDDIRQFEEDTKLLKALLAATGQDPAKFNIPTLDIKTTTLVPTTETTTTSKPTESTRAQTTTPSIDADITRFQEDAKLLQALLQATGQNNGNFKIPDITGVTSNVRIASNPLTTSLGSNPTTPINVRPIYTTLRTTTLPPTTVTVPTTFQPRATDSTTARISTTFPPFRRRPTATTVSTDPTTVATARRVPIPGFIVTTEIPTSSTFSVEEDLAFLNNLKSVLNTNTDSTDPEAALANRIIALAVDRSLNEIKSGQGTERMGKNLVPTTAPTTTTTTTTTTTPRPTSAAPSTPSIEDDLRQFQEDTKLLQALLKATGQDPSKLNLPTIPNINANVSPKIPPGVHSELNLLSNLLASPSPLNEPFDSLTQEPKEQIKTTITTTPKPFGAKIAVKDDVKNIQDDGKLLQTLINLQGVQETTTQKSKIAITGQSTDEALKKLIQQTKSPGMVQDATKMPIAISTEYGKSNDALLAALLKEQGFGPTTASSLDEQIRLAALLNQVVVTPKARRTTTPPPPPAPRRPILDGLAWLWQQWRETGPGTGAQQRPSRRPDPSPTAAVSASQATSNRVNWFGSGPFVGNADDKPNNRIPLDPPRAVTSEQTPGRGQLVSAAINVTRAFSQFLGAAIQGAAQTVQSVIRAGQRAATDVYSNGSGASG